MLVSLRFPVAEPWAGSGAGRAALLAVDTVVGTSLVTGSILALVIYYLDAAFYEKILLPELILSTCRRAEYLHPTFVMTVLIIGGAVTILSPLIAEFI